MSKSRSGSCVCTRRRVRNLAVGVRQTSGVTVTRAERGIFWKPNHFISYYRSGNEFRNKVLFNRYKMECLMLFFPKGYSVIEPRLKKVNRDERRCLNIENCQWMWQVPDQWLISYVLWSSKLTIPEVLKFSDGHLLKASLIGATNNSFVPIKIYRL